MGWKAKRWDHRDRYKREKRITILSDGLAYLYKRPGKSVFLLIITDMNLRLDSHELLSYYQTSLAACSSNELTKPQHYHMPVYHQVNSIVVNDIINKNSFESLKRFELNVTSFHSSLPVLAPTKKLRYKILINITEWFSRKMRVKKDPSLLNLLEGFL